MSKTNSLEDLIITIYALVKCLDLQVTEISQV